MISKIIYWIKLKNYNGIGYFIEDFIEQEHQFGMLDEKRTVNIRKTEQTYHLVIQKKKLFLIMVKLNLK